MERYAQQIRVLSNCPETIKIARELMAGSKSLQLLPEILSKFQEKIRVIFIPVKSAKEALETVPAENSEVKVHMMPDGGQTLRMRKLSIV
jgi:nickel-dependent lactate racemase